MADKTTAGANATLTAMLAGATVHLTVSGTEVGGGVGYNAQPFGTVTPSGGVASNLAIINFGLSTGSWGSVNLIQVKTSGGTIYMQKSITPQAIVAGYEVKIPIGDLDVQETLCTSTQGEACPSLSTYKLFLTGTPRR